MEVRNEDTGEQFALDEDEFYKLAIKDDFPNTMVFEFTAPKGEPIDHTFSPEGFENIGTRISKYALARCISFFDTTGKGVKVMRATVSVELSDGDLLAELPPLAEGEYPFYSFTPTEVDGSRRLTRPAEDS